MNSTITNAELREANAEQLDPGAGNSVTDRMTQ